MLSKNYQMHEVYTVQIVALDLSKKSFTSLAIRLSWY